MLPKKFLKTGKRREHRPPPGKPTISCERPAQVREIPSLLVTARQVEIYSRMLAQGYGFWHRISIAHSCFNQKKSTRPPLLQCLVHCDHGAVFIDKPGSQPPCTTAWDSSIAVQLRELRSAVAVKPKRSAVNNTSSDSNCGRRSADLSIRLAQRPATVYPAKTTTNSSSPNAVRNSAYGPQV